MDVQSTQGQILPASISAFLEAFSGWARAQPDIEAVALVGSYARDTPKEDSDVDLIILTRNVDRYLRDRKWILLFGQLTEWRQENYGRVTAVRSYYESGLEVEYGFSTPDWAAAPIDAGTIRVVSQGIKVLHDPHGSLAGMENELRSS